MIISLGSEKRSNIFSSWMNTNSIYLIEWLSSINWREWLKKFLRHSWDLGTERKNESKTEESQSMDRKEFEVKVHRLMVCFIL